MKELLQKYFMGIVVMVFFALAAVFAHLYLVQKALNDNSLRANIYEARLVRTQEVLSQLNQSMTPELRKVFSNIGYQLPTVTQLPQGK